MHITKRARLFITIGIYSLICIFIGLYIYGLDFSKLSGLTINWWFILAALPFSILSRIFLPFAWVTLIKGYVPVDSLHEYWQLNFIYAKTWLGKYVPGNFTWVGGKIYFASERGISKTVLGITSIVEAGLQLLTALLIGVVFLFISGAYSNFSTAYIVFFLTASVVGIVALAPPIFNSLIKWGYKRFKKKQLDKKYYLRLWHLVRVASLYFFIHALSALPIYFLFKAVGYHLSLIQLMYITGAFIFAGAVGTMAIFVPSGFGVREGVILLLLANVLPAEVSLVIVVVLRIWSILLDLAYWAFSYTIIKMLGKPA
jgi:glycosyltransferase 2 family protein